MIRDDLEALTQGDDEQHRQFEDGWTIWHAELSLPCSPSPEKDQ